LSIMTRGRPGRLRGSWCAKGIASPTMSSKVAVMAVFKYAAISSKDSFMAS